MQIDEDESISARLVSPPVRQTKHLSATALVRRHYDAIASAWMTGRHEGKTWEEIGRDLRPTAPIPAGTVGRAFQRVTAERQAISVPTLSAKPATQNRVEVSDPHRPEPRPHNPFARTIDPVRLDDSQGA